MNESEINREIQELIEHNERLVKIAVGNSKIGEEQQVKNLIGFLTNLLEVIYAYKSEQPKKYNYLIQGSFQYENPLKQKEALNNDYYNRISFLGSFRSGLTGIWQQCFVSNQYNACQYLIYNIQKILARLSDEDGNEVLISECNLLLRQALSFGIRRHSTQSAFLIAPAFQVYFNVVFNESDDRFRFRLNYLGLFDSWCWGSLVTVINNKADKVFDSLVETIFQGHYLSSLSIGRAYEYFNTLSPHIREIADLDQKIFLISNLAEANEAIQEAHDKVEKYQNEIAKDYTKEQVKKALESMIHKSLKINNFQVYIFLMGAFLVFKKRFDWIESFWNFKQPLDADAHWGSNEILPESLTSVFSYFLKSYDLRNRFDLAWEKRHGISLYYDEYGLLLIARLFFVPKIYVYQDPTNTSHLINSINQKDFDLVVNTCESLLARIPIIKQSKLFPESFRKEGVKHKVQLTDEVDSLLNKIITSAKEAKQNSLHSQEFTAQEFDQLVDQANVNFRKENQVADILEKEGCYQTLDLMTEDIKQLSFIFSRPKSEFIEQWSALGPSLGFEVARNLSYRMCSEIVRVFDSKAGLSIHKVEASRFELDFKNLFQFISGYETPFILGVGINFHSLFWNVAEFSFSRGDDQNRVGEYRLGDKTIAVYNITNWAPRRSFFIIDAKFFGKLFQLELGAKDARRYIQGERKEETENQILKIEFKYESYFKFNFLEAARYIKVVVGE